MIANEEYWAMLIAKDLSGNCSDAEARTLHEWIEADDENKAYYEEMQRVWNVSGTEIAPQFNVLGRLEQANREIAKGVDGDHRGAKTGRIRPLYLISAAASVLIVIAAAFLITRSGVSEGDQVLVAAASPDSLNKLVVLPDDSRVWIKGGSSISYQRDFDPRKVTLDGEAFFDVQPDPAHAFSVVAGGAVANVLGTRFNVRMEESGDVELIVEEGRVAFGAAEQKVARKPAFERHEAARFEAETFTVEHIDASDINIMSWRTGKMVFEDTKLREVLQRLEEYYDYTYTTATPGLLDCQLRVEFNKNTHDEVMEALGFILNLEYETRGDTIILSGEPCNPGNE